MERACHNFTMFLTGAIVYFYFEIFVRGYSHISMFLLGGLCFFLVGRIGNRLIDIRKPLWVRVICIIMMSSFIITFLELLTGLVVNVYMDLKVWDYTSMQMNFMGQICLIYSGLWGLMGMPCVYFYGLIEHFILNDNEKDFLSAK